MFAVLAPTMAAESDAVEHIPTIQTLMWARSGERFGVNPKVCSSQ